MARRSDPAPEAKKPDPVTPPKDETPKPGTAVATGLDALPAHLRDDAAAMGGAGTSDRAEDLSLPFLYIVQKGSPQVNRRAPEFMEGVEAGDVLNTATQQVYKCGGGATIPVLHAHMIRREVEWITRAAGGGYVSTHDVDTPLLRQVREVAKPQGKGTFRMLPNGHQLVATAYHFVVLPESLDVAVIGLTSTGLQTSRRWNTMMRSHKVRGANGPIILPGFSHVYELRTVYQQNESGDWFTYGVADMGLVTEEQMSAYAVAKSFFLHAMEHGVPIGRPPAAASDVEDADAGGGVHPSDEAPI